MAHDYIDIGSGHLRLNDFHIWTLRHFLLEVLDRESTASLNTDASTLNELCRFLESWQWLGPGIIDGGNFNSFATSSSRFEMIRCLLVKTRERLREFGEHIPLTYLDQHVNSSLAWYTAAPPVETFTSILDRMIHFAGEGVKEDKT